MIGIAGKGGFGDADCSGGAVAAAGGGAEGFAGAADFFGDAAGLGAFGEGLVEESDPESGIASICPSGPWRSFGTEPGPDGSCCAEAAAQPSASGKATSASHNATTKPIFRNGFRKARWLPQGFSRREWLSDQPALIIGVAAHLVKVGR
jgi:hypothetical protein